MNWETLSNRYLLRSPWLQVREDRVRMPGGHVIEAYHVIEAPDWVCVVCTDDAGDLIVVEQYRHGLGNPTFELPAGAIEVGEAPEDAARRELREETGYEAVAWSYIGSCSPDPSRHTNRAHFFVARGARQVKDQKLDPAEQIRVHQFVPAHVVAMIDRGAFPHGIHQTALLRARLRGLL